MLGAVLAVLAAVFAPAHGQTLVKKVLFFDDDDVLYRSGTRQALFSLQKYDPITGTTVIDPVLKPDSWDANTTFSLCSVSCDPARTPKYIMWYQVDSTSQGFTGADRRYSSVIAYATSSNGLTWTKPNLRSTTGFTYPEGTGMTNNNIVLIGAGSAFGNRSGCSVVYDPDASDPDRKYKMVFTDWTDPLDPSVGVGLQVAFSPDGIRWTKHSSPEGPLQKIGFNHQNVPVPAADAPVYLSEGFKWAIPATLSDVVNVFRDGAGGYVIYGSMPLDGPAGELDWRRGMGRSESADFLTWSSPEVASSPDDLDLKKDDGSPSNDFDISFQDSPVFPYEGLYLCFNQLLDQGTNLREIELMSSRDGRRWNRFRKGDYGDVAVLPRSPVSAGTLKDFDSKSISVGSCVIDGNNLRFYYAGSGTTNGIGLAQTLRDRLTGIRAYWTWKDFGSSVPIQPTGQVTLRPVDLTNLSTIKINAKVDSGGSIKAELLTPDGYRLTNFTADKSTAITGDSVEREVKWGTSTIADAPNGPHLVRFHLYRATLYSCSFFAPAGAPAPVPTPSPTPLPLPLPVTAAFAAARSTLLHEGTARDIELSTDGPPAEETRKGRGGAGNQFTIVMRFDKDLAGGTAQVSKGAGSVSSAQVSPTDARELVVELDGVANAQVLEILASVTTPSGGSGTGKVSVGFLLGDVNRDGAVNVADVGMVNSQKGKPVSESNLRSDVNCDGRIDAQDVSLTHSKSPSTLPR